MGFAKLMSAQPGLLGAQIVTVEADLAKGLHAFALVGLPDKAVEESRDRVSAAIKNSGWKSPKQRNQKITIALAPADLRKSGPIYDLPIALCYLMAADDIRFDPSGRLFIGELALDGSVRRVDGVLASVIAAKKAGYTEAYVPKENADEAGLIDGIDVYAVGSLEEVVSHLLPESEIAREHPDRPAITLKRMSAHKRRVANAPSPKSGSFQDIRGQEIAKRGLLIAAAGGHNIAMWGPPGTGKTMLARAFTELLPPLTQEEAIEVTSIHSVAGMGKGEIINESPLRSPHHTSSYVSVVGGGATPKPGEVTLAHHGVLFLDEFPEFDKRVIESLRQPLEEGMVHISRAKGSERFPARFILVAAMNPCPCGYFGDAKKQCVCNPASISRYQRKISGPIVDRIDLWIEVPRISHDALAPRNERGDSDDVLGRYIAAVNDARARQRERFDGSAKTNAMMTVRDIDERIRLSSDVSALLSESAKKLDLSPRAYHRIIKLARTIADLDSSKEILSAHMLEALQYRPKRLFAGL